MKASKRTVGWQFPRRYRPNVDRVYLTNDVFGDLS
jgi:hypothetical protein